MKMDTFVQLIKDLRQNAVDDDTDPGNVLLQVYTSPYEVVSMTDSVRVLKPTVTVWGDGRTYHDIDSNGALWDAPSCGWFWGTGGAYG